MRKTLLVGLTMALTSFGNLAAAEGHISAEQIEAAVKARNAHMDLIAFNLGALGAIAKEEVAYDAGAATAAAGNLVALATMSQDGYWLPGSDSDSVEGSRALPAIWAADSEVGAKFEAFATAAMAMETAAGTDLDALKAAMGPLGGSCRDCHESYRKSNR